MAGNYRGRRRYQPSDDDEEVDRGRPSDDVAGSYRGRHRYQSSDDDKEVDPSDDDEKVEIIRRHRSDTGSQSDHVRSMARNSEYGWIRIVKITNNTDRALRFKNPYNGRSGEIMQGETDERDCKGPLPYYSHDKRYEISYFNKNLGKRVKIEIKDLGGNWETSFWHNGSVHDGVTIEDIQVLKPTKTTDIAFGAHIRLNTDGYEVIEQKARRTKAKIVYGGT